MLRDSIIAAIRTGVAFVVTYIITWLVGLGFVLDNDISAALNVALFGLCVAGYNLVVGLLERKVNPFFGVLLGIPKAPAYGDVGTQTPPPAKPLVGSPEVDRGAVQLAVIGAVVVLIGILVWAFAAVDLLAVILVVVGAVLVIVDLAGRNTRAL